MEAFIHRSQLSCTPIRLVLSIVVRVLWKRSTGFNDGLYVGVVVCCILNSVNSYLHKLFKTPFHYQHCSIITLAIICASLLGIRYTLKYMLKLYSAVSILLKKRIFCLADNIKNPFRNLLNIPSNTLCPLASLW